MHNGTEWGFWGFGFGHWIFGLLFWVLIIVVVVAVARSFSSNSASRNSKSALDILEERYARGEIDRNEFERMRQDLER